MIEVAAQGNVGLMVGMLDKMGQGGAARARLYTGLRGDTSTLVAVVYFADVAGAVNATTGALELAVGVESLVQNSTAPTWARVSNGNEQHLFDCDARLSTTADTGQELVITAPSGFYAGASVQITSGAFTALPA